LSEVDANYKTDKLRIKSYSGVNDEGLRPSSRLFDKRIWRVKDVAEFLDCSIGHIYNLTSDEKIPKVKKGKFVYFIPEMILDWVQEGDLK
jgi:predicted DNA-binding transcriptional regulator AlpA